MNEKPRRVINVRSMTNVPVLVFKQQLPLKERNQIFFYKRIKVGQRQEMLSHHNKNINNKQTKQNKKQGSHQKCVGSRKKI